MFHLESLNPNNQATKLNESFYKHNRGYKVQINYLNLHLPKTKKVGNDPNHTKTKPLLFGSRTTKTQVEGQTSVSKLMYNKCHYCGKRNILNQFHWHNQCKFNPSVNQNIAKINRANYRDNSYTL